MITANLIGLAGYVLLPTAPPRMFPEEGFVDTLAQSASLNHGSSLIELASNPYAAMPSLHAADALIIGFALASLVRPRWLKVAWTLWPTWVWFTVMATGNHYWLDIAAGVGVAALAATRARLDREPARRAGPRARRAPQLTSRHMSTTPKAPGPERRTYQDEVRKVAARGMGHLGETSLTPDALTVFGVLLCAAGAVCVWFEYRGWGFFLAGAALFVVGSVLDILDGALARTSGKGTPFGAFLDSTVDRMGEAFMLGAIALVLMRDENEWGVAPDLRRARGLVPRELHARAGRGDRPARRRRARIAGRARRRDHDRPRARAAQRVRAARRDRAPRGDRLDHRRAARALRATQLRERV